MPTRQRVLDFIATVEQGRILEAIDRFYTDDTVMQDNHNPPTIGKAANATREEQFVGFIREVHENRANAVLVDGNRSVINWHFEFTGADGNRVRFDQLAVQTWDGAGDDARIAHERFVYDPATLPVGSTDSVVAGAAA